MVNTQRVKKIQRILKNPLLVKKKEDLFYVTGRSFKNVDGWLLLKKNQAVFFHGGLENPPAGGRIYQTDLYGSLGNHIRPGEALELPGDFTYAEGRYIKLKIKGRRVKVLTGRNPVHEARLIKSDAEIRLVRKSMEIVAKVFNKVKHKLQGRDGSRPVSTEEQLAEFIKKQGLVLGAEDVSFPPIVAAGANAAVPHHVPSSKVLKQGESIILDFGFKYKGYCSDFTRTVFLGSVPPRLKTAYIQVEKAYNESMNFCNHPHLTSPLKGEGWGGVKAKDVHQISVNILKEKRFDKYFIHSLGHGTGLEIHESPSLSPNSKDVLRDGMVFSIEPGVYLPGVGGIRIEDLVYLENGKVQKFIDVSTALESNVIV